MAALLVLQDQGLSYGQCDCQRAGRGRTIEGGSRACRDRSDAEPFLRMRSKSMIPVIHRSMFISITPRCHSTPLVCGHYSAPYSAMDRTTARYTLDFKRSQFFFSHSTTVSVRHFNNAALTRAATSWSMLPSAESVEPTCLENSVSSNSAPTTWNAVGSFTSFVIHAVLLKLSRRLNRAKRSLHACLCRSRSSCLLMGA